MQGVLLIGAAVGAVASSVIATRAYRRNSLDASGAISGFLVMTFHIVAGYRFGALLLVFFFTSSKSTKVG
ncbi:hypothetical protein MLD38_006278 [Melastoma candidum]|uniref:Uncharacterized protein n=1 Tax=Melastoma candidum TaxID=119954 RepID=A0ACB9RMG0_9MYRT|nr:hypothetical protein MLD38_006278 [Melastoma candidum]